MRVNAFILSTVPLAMMLIGGCGSRKMLTGPDAGVSAGSATASSSARMTTAATSTTLNGSAGEMSAYYDGKLFTINFLELPKSGEAAALAHNSGVNIIYQSDPGLPGGQPFISVLNAIQGDGFNPLWEEFQITFNAGHTPRQLFSDDEITAAARAGEITVTDTDELYRCSVVGSKN